MTPRFCGRCGAVAAPGNVFCTSCGSPLDPQASEAAVPPSSTTPPAVPPVSPMGPMGGPPGPPTGVPPVPWTYWPPPPKRKRTWIWAIVAVVVVVVFVLGTIGVFLGSQPKATLVRIDKSGASGNSMFFNVTIRTSGATIEVDHLHLQVRSVYLGATYDQNLYYNLERIPGGSEFVWDAYVQIDPINEAAFTYVFTIEVNSVQTDTSTVS